MKGGSQKRGAKKIKREQIDNRRLIIDNRQYNNKIII